MNRQTTSAFRLLSRPAFICLLLALATLAVYSTVREYGFVGYDDSDYFFANPHVVGGLTGPNVKWAFTSGEYANWHPLTWISLMLDATLFGKGAAAPHLVNVLLHMANAILVFLLFRQMTGAHLRSAAVAMLFALHPLRVESVSWASERKDVLSGFFGILSLLCYARYAKRDSGPASSVAGYASPSYWLCLLFFACGLMAKPMLVTLPFVMLLLDFWPLQSFGSSRFLRLLVEKIPFFLLAVVVSVVTFVVQRKAGAVDTLTVIPFGLRVENTFISYARYLAKIFAPVNLATPYPAPAYQPVILVMLAVVLFAGLCLVAIGLRKKYPFVFTGWFWFAGMLVPVIGLVQVGGAAMADRYAYLPIVGILVIVVWTAGEICARHQPPWNVVIACATVIFLFCGLRARNQVSVWRDDSTLFRHALDVTENNYVASLNLGYWYSKQGMVKCLDYYHDALRMAPNDPTALYDVGNALAKLGRLNEAIDDYQRALQISPDQPDILDNLGFALAQTKRLPEATQCFEAALKLKPDSPGAHNNLATVFFIQGRYAEAKEQYEMALQLQPDNVRMMINLGDTCVRLNDKVSAVEYYQRALQIEPDNQTARSRLQALGQQNPN